MISAQQHFQAYVGQLGQLLARLDQREIENFVQVIQDVCRRNKTIFIVGNGGSAATASHWCNDLSKGIFYRNGKRVRCLSLTDNMSWITAIANDISFEAIFSDQIKTLGSEGDLLICITASGNSPNILRAIEAANAMQLETLAVVGFDGGQAARVSKHKIHIPTVQNAYGLVEDVQMILNHFLCDFLVAQAYDSD